jgi:type II secretory pathway pseudopilin PulG
MEPEGARSRRRFGFGILEIVVLLAVASVIAVLAATVLLQANSLERVQETWTKLERTRLAEFNAAAGGGIAFFQDIGRNPQVLSQLVNALVSGDKDACGNSYTGAQRGSWMGPYGGFTIDASVGLATPIGIGNNLLVRNPTGGGVGTLAIVFPNVDVQDASLLDQVFDNANGNAAGVVQWTIPVGGLTTMSYLWAITNAC